MVTVACTRFVTPVTGRRRHAMDDRLVRARRGRRRLILAGWALVAAGPLLALTGLVLVPFLFPFALAAGGTTLIGGRQLARLRAPIAAVVSAAVTLLAGLGIILGALDATSGLWPSAVPGLLLVALAGTALVIVFADATYLPADPGPRLLE